MSKNEEFKILDARSHCRQRPGMYVGSTSLEEIEQFVFGKWKKVQYTPALFKMINEIIDNSVDEFLRSNGKFATKIDVSFEGEFVTVTDNGRGIPQDIILTPEGDKIPRPVAAWTKTNAGTSFGDNRTTIGAHGLGAALVNFMSSTFVGKTWQNGTLLEVASKDGGLQVDVRTKTRSGSGTEVTFSPDFSLFETDTITNQEMIDLVEDRLISLQMVFPEIAFSFNRKKIQIRDLKRYAELFAAEGSSIVLEKSETLAFFFAASVDGFRTNSFINGVNTRQGGTYVDYIVNNVVDELLLLIKKKHKIDVSKSVIKNGLTFVMFARNFVNPKFDSQTKERLTNSPSNVREHFDASAVHDFKYIAKKIFASNDIIEPIIAAQLAKKMADEKRDALVAQKKLKKVKVAKHIAASSPTASLSLCEGDSAKSFFLAVRDPSKHGIYPLRGVVMNTWDMKPSEVLKNKELSEVIAILGLDINKPNDLSTMTYQNVWTLCDADVDGNKIATLLIAFFYKFWPKLFEEGRIFILRTPIMIAEKGSDHKWFYNYTDADAFKKIQKGYEIRYIKGLGLLTETEYSKILNDPVLYKITIDDMKLFEMMFGSDAQARKEFMMA
jgi:DNA gyrase/topoisomerase IV subunit B